MYDQCVCILSFNMPLTHTAYTALNRLRIGGGNESQVVDFQGTAFTPVPYVDTEYEWLVFPISLVSLTIIFLLATILKSQRLRSRVWESSNFATLKGLASEVNSELGGLFSISEMEEKAKNVKVIFHGKSKGDVKYRLVEVKQNKYWMGQETASL